jgi:hypothetical protein
MTKKKSPAEANGDCTICNGWVDDGRGGTCVFTNDFWTPYCPYLSSNKAREKSKAMSNEAIIDRMQKVIDGYKACTDDLLAKIEELTAERDKWEATAKQAMESYNIARRDRDAWFERYMRYGQQDKDETCPDNDWTCPIDNEPCPIAEEEAVKIIQKTRKAINALRAHYGAGPTMMTDEQIAEGLEVYSAKKDVGMMVIDDPQYSLKEMKK